MKEGQVMEELHSLLSIYLTLNGVLSNCCRSFRSVS